MSIHRLDTTLTIECVDDLGVEVDVDVRVDYEYTPATGNGWDEPREPEWCEPVAMYLYDPAFGGWRDASRLLDLFFGLAGDRMMETLLTKHRAEYDVA